MTMNDFPYRCMLQDPSGDLVPLTSGNWQDDLMPEMVCVAHLLLVSTHLNLSLEYEILGNLHSCYEFLYILVGLF